MFKVHGTMIRLTKGDTGLLTIATRGRMLTGSDAVLLTIARRSGGVIYKSIQFARNGQVQFAFANRQTAKWPEAEYEWDVRVVLDAVVEGEEIISGTEVITPLRKCSFIVEEAVGRVSLTEEGKTLSSRVLTMAIAEQNGALSVSVEAVQGLSSGGTIETDSTLSVAGAAADAKATGDAIGQLFARMEEMIDRDELDTAVDNALAEAKESGAFKGDKGDTGATGEKGEPGPAGSDGKTPVKGVDYWTAADRTAVINDVLLNLPNASGVSF